MKAAIVTTGDEIMAGNVTDTNAAWMSDHCWRLGIEVVWRYAVGDEAAAIGEACRLASEKADVVLVSGGLGPTADDITLAAAGRAFEKNIEAEGKAIPNKVGTAPGCQIRLGKADFFFLPGVPKELYPMFEDFVLPWLREKTGGRIVYREKILKCFGVPEATLDTLLKGAALGGVRLSFRVRFPEVWLKLVSRGADLEKAVRNVRARAGQYIFGEGKETLPGVVGILLKKREATLSIAESCTGGFVSNWLTDVPGASGYFERGLVTYSNVSKEKLLGVKKETLKKFGAVSEAAAKAMAAGIRKTSGTTYGIGITGIAGPSGGRTSDSASAKSGRMLRAPATPPPSNEGGGAKPALDEKPVGTVFIALAGPKRCEVKHFCFQRDRLEFKQLAAATALDWLRRELL